jgi:hypothetical protein
MVPIRLRGQDVEKPKVVTDFNSSIGCVDLSDVYLTNCCIVLKLIQDTSVI